MLRTRDIPIVALLLWLITASALAQLPKPDAANVVYATVDTTSLLLDIYLPKNMPKPYPAVVWVHGGGWLGGSKEAPNGTWLIPEGFALVSIDYRLSNAAIFPAQINDCKGAIRWLRAHASTYGLDPGRIGVFGSSAGGHLVALMGTSGGVAELEGDIGGNTDRSSSVQAVCDWYGPSNIPTMGDYPSSLDHRGADSPEGRLIGGPIMENLDRARAASPITYVGSDDPPFLIQHGTQDMTVPFHQSVELDSALRAAGVDCTFIPVVNGGHGPGFEADTVHERVIAFFKRVLMQGASFVPAHDAANEPILTLQPNPVHQSGTIRFRPAAAAEYTLELYTSLGERRGLLASGAGTGDEQSISLRADHLPPGAYFLRLKAGDVTATRAIVVR